MTGVAVNEFGFGVVCRFLMQLLNGCHFATDFGHLDSITDEDRPVIDFRHEGGRQDGQDQAAPKGGEGVNEDRFAVEEIEEPVLENLFQA